MPKRSSVGSVPPVCLLFGRKARENLFDEYLAKIEIERIKAALSSEGAITVTESPAAESDLADVLDEVSTPAMWGASRLVILTGAATILAPGPGRQDFAPILERMTAIAQAGDSPGHLVMVAEALEVRGQTPVLKWEPAERLLKAIAKARGLFPCMPPYESDLKGLLAARAREKGFQLQASAAMMLISLVGTDQMALMEELEKLCIGAEGRRITEEDIEALAAERPEKDVFRLADSILDCDVAGSLKTLRGLRETPATRGIGFIIGGICATFRRYLRAAREVQRGADARGAAESAGVPSFFRREFAERLRHWSPEELSALMESALSCDVAVKTGSMGDETALELFVIEAASKNFQKTLMTGRWLHEI